MLCDVVALIAHLPAQKAVQLQPDPAKGSSPWDMTMDTLTAAGSSSVMRMFAF
jgi:hypothetical protein